MDQKQNPKYFETPRKTIHQKERFWKILFPLIVAGVLVLAIMLWLILADGHIEPDVEILAGVATVFLGLIFIVFALIKIALLVAMVFGLTKLKPVIPRAGTRLLQAFEKARWYLRKAADISVQPILSLKEGAQKFEQAKRSLEVRLLEKGK